MPPGYRSLIVCATPRRTIERLRTSLVASLTMSSTVAGWYRRRTRRYRARGRSRCTRSGRGRRDTASVTCYPRRRSRPLWRNVGTTPRRRTRVPCTSVWQPTMRLLPCVSTLPMAGLPRTWLMVTTGLQFERCSESKGIITPCDGALLSCPQVVTGVTLLFTPVTPPVTVSHLHKHPYFID